MNIRLAEGKDCKQLIKLRWDSTIEFDEKNEIEEALYDDFEKECQAFLENALTSDQWFIWVAEENGKIVSNIYIKLIQKVPRPGRVTYPFAYMTNVFTTREFRNKGIGSTLLSRIKEWTRVNKYEFIIVWPSDDSINYYKKNGYIHCTEPMEYCPS
ncbi:GNAT family N-acetyltransferase [Bacillus suaedae]|uniref:GNAT family N-acetyltransferase n=1 Tax=Halalkalibacter suaedae TaxID=2822140 RepID=A0A940WT76_9BACI|nr:GNAT family N-acetyltransferase [Bacillus suaedae]MBP3950207.1 GNAT family N-acetyltransferase [Bacillus suaedae]